jgi:hypothetical protein
VSHRLKSVDVIDVLSDLFILRGVPEHIRSDNGPEFIAKAVQEWIRGVGAKTAYITPGSPWEKWKSAIWIYVVATGVREFVPLRPQSLRSSTLDFTPRV